MTPALMISLVVAIVVMLIVIVAFLVYRDYSGSRSLDQRLDRLTAQSTPTLESAGILREQMFPEDGASLIERMLPRLPSLTVLFQQADFKMQPGQFWTFTMVLGLIGAVIPIAAGISIWVAPFAGLTLAVLPFMYVLYLRSNRLKKFAEQLSEALELVARALRAGHSLAAAMQNVSTEMPNPIAQEFGRVYEEQNLGIGLEQAMRNLAARIPNLDLKFFVTAVIIQRTTGGDLAEILDKIGYLIRERYKLLGMVKALTAEGRLSGVILIALPFILLGLLLKMNYDYVSALWTDKRGRLLSGLGIFMMILGALVIRKIVNIKV